MGTSSSRWLWIVVVFCFVSANLWTVFFFSSSSSSSSSSFSWTTLFANDDYVYYPCSHSGVVSTASHPQQPTTETTTEPEAAAAPREPESFCSATEPGRSQFVLERRSVRDMICSNNTANLLSQLYQDQTASGFTTSKSNNDDSNVTLPKIIFYHFSKTGGESLEKAFGIHKNHRTWSLRQKDHVGDYVAVTIVRNPFDRMLSWFRFCLHGWRGRVPSPEPQCKLAFWKTEEFTKGQNATLPALRHAFEAWLADILLALKYVYPPKNIYYGYHMHMPHVQWIGGVHPLHLDYIIRFEHYQEDFLTLAQALGLKNAKLPRANGSGSNATQKTVSANFERQFRIKYRADAVQVLSEVSSYRLMYTDRARSLVETTFASDLQQFHYSF